MAGYDGGDEREVGELVQDGEDPGGEYDYIQELHPAVAKPDHDGDRPNEREPPEIGRDHERSTLAAVDDDAEGKGRQEERQELSRP